MFFPAKYFPLKPSEISRVEVFIVTLPPSGLTADTLTSTAFPRERLFLSIVETYPGLFLMNVSILEIQGSAALPTLAQLGNLEKYL